jgi:hypothetical protein
MAKRSPSSEYRNSFRGESLLLLAVRDEIVAISSRTDATRGALEGGTSERIVEKAPPPSISAA